MKDAKAQPVAGQVVAFKTTRGLGQTNLVTALTDVTGKATVVLSPASSTAAGADDLVASVSFAGKELTASAGFQVQATDVKLTSLSSAVGSVGAYGQTSLSLSISGASVGAPVNVVVNSSCASQGKATVSPSTFSVTASTFEIQYKDAGCGALQSQDKIQASIVGASASVSLNLPIATPDAASIAFISASPEVIYIKGSGLTESSSLTFEVRDRAGNVLPNRRVNFSLLNRAGGVTMEGGTADVVQLSDAAGRATVRVNSGTVPTPLRVAAALQDFPAIATVSSNLGVAVGLPSQLNFSLASQTLNIEGFDVDGTPNSYTVTASDRNGNPVPAGTSINFVAEGGQVEPIKLVVLNNGLARTTAGFVSSNPRPADGRVTITAYALGEESFIDLNGNNAYDPGEPFQDLGDVFKDRVFDGVFDSTLDELIPLSSNNNRACVPASAASASAAAILSLDPSIPSAGGSTCDGAWTGAGRVYVRRATETVLSTSAGRPLWADISGLAPSCRRITLQTGPNVASAQSFVALTAGDTWYTTGDTTTLSFVVADRNTFPLPSSSGAVGRLNPMAAGTTVGVSTTATNTTVAVAGGSPIPSTTSASIAVASVSFASGQTSAVVTLTTTSPSGLITSFPISVQKVATLPAALCQ